MPYPTYLARVTNYTQAASAGQALSEANLDTEMNNNVAVVNAINAWLRGVTDSTGHLVNLAAATAQALAGSQRFVATASQTVFDTTIAYDSAFTSLNVEVFADGVRLDSSLITPSDNAGDLRVTLSAGQAVGTVVIIGAFSSGAGLLTRLQSIANGDGASIVGLEDSGALYAAGTAETAFAEVMTKLNLLITNLGTISNYLKKDGSVTMTGSLVMGSQKITGLLDGTNNQDAATVAQLTSATASLSDLYTQFVKKDGTVAMTGPLAMGAQKITGLAPGTASTDAVNVSQMGTTFSTPTGTVSAFAGLAAPTGWVLCDGAQFDSTNATYAPLYAVISNRFGGVNPLFKVPDLRGMSVIGAGTAQTYTDLVSGASVTTSARNLNDKLGEEKHAQTVAELAAHTHPPLNGGTQFKMSGAGASPNNANADAYYENYVNTTGSTGSNTPFNVFQPSTCLNYVIKL